MLTYQLALLAALMKHYEYSFARFFSIINPVSSNDLSLESFLEGVFKIPPTVVVQGLF